MASKKLFGFVKVKSGKFIPIERSIKIMTETAPVAESDKKIEVKKFIKIPCIKADGTSEEISVPQRGETELPKNNIFLEPISKHSYKVIKKHSYLQTNKNQQECACRKLCNCYKDLLKIYEELKQKYEELNIKLQELEQNKVLCKLAQNEIEQSDNMQLKLTSVVSNEINVEPGISTFAGEEYTNDCSNVDNIYESNVFVDPKITLSSPLIGSNVNMGTSLNFPKVQNEIDDPLQLKVYPYWVQCDIPDNDGYYPIHHAVLDHDIISVTRQCIVLKIKTNDINLECSDGLTPLLLAVMYNAPIEITKMLLKFGAAMDFTDDSGNNCFHIAATKNYMKTLQALNVWNNIECINQCNHDGYTPLMISAIENNIEDINTLVKHGVELNVTDKKSGRTALFYAVENNAVETVELLIKAGADITIKNFAGLTVLDLTDDMTTMHQEIKQLIVSNSFEIAQKRKRTGDTSRTTKRKKQ